MRKTGIKKNSLSVSLNQQGGIYLLGSRQDVDRLYQAMDVFVLPSRYEGLPVVAVEAQASGLPCILSNRITEEVKINRNVVFLGLEAGSTKWAKKVLQENNKRTINDKMDEYDIAKQANRLAKYYRKLLEDTGCDE